ncbi:butyrophilin subfamily 3 member A2-like [Cebidichthys violaceus]|uniref:butyrophilin subfamily 3 member A2-like n=1 Tax=Cebidichthys violaceus TaxID=271503 RepID=UPI0035CBE62C
MFHHWERGAIKSHLKAVNTLVFYHTAVFLLLTHFCGGQSQMVGPSKPILTMVSDDIMLPCHLEPATDVVAKTLEWSRLDLNPRFVHVRRDGVELLVNQNPSFVGRTSVATDSLKHGDISLKLSKVKLSDEGKYRCHIPTLGTSVVDLVVGALSSPVVIIAEIDKAIRRVVLQCESRGWYPEPEVLWLDGEGNLLSAGPTETIRGPDHLYTVSSRVTVEKRHSNSFTCRVQQRNINQTRETQIGILDDVFMTTSSSGVRITVVLAVCFLISCISVAFFIFGKQRQNKSHSKMDCDNETKDGTGEKYPLVERCTKTKDLDDEMLQDKEEEKKDILHVISVLMEQEKELKISREKDMSLLREVELEREKNEKKLELVNIKYSWNKGDKKSSLSKIKHDLDNKNTKYHNRLKTTQEIQHKTDEIMKIMKERMKKVENQIEQFQKQHEETKCDRRDSVEPSVRAIEEKILIH